MRPKDLFEEPGSQERPSAGSNTRCLERDRATVGRRSVWLDAIRDALIKRVQSVFAFANSQVNQGRAGFTKTAALFGISQGLMASLLGHPLFADRAELQNPGSANPPGDEKKQPNDK